MGVESPTRDRKRDGGIGNASGWGARHGAGGDAASIVVAVKGGFGGGRCGDAGSGAAVWALTACVSDSPCSRHLAPAGGRSFGLGFEDFLADDPPALARSHTLSCALCD